MQQTATLMSVGVQSCSNADGPDVAKQVLRLLFERLEAICCMRHFMTQRGAIAARARQLQTAMAAAPAAAAGQQLPATAASRHRASHPASLVGGASSSGKQQAISPEESLSSGHDTGTMVRLPLADAASQQPSVASNGGGGRGAGGGGGGGGGAVGLFLPPEAVHAERFLLATVQGALRMTESMHQTVMRLQQFLESSEVQASRHAKQAALHVSAVGLDAGMYNTFHLTAHARAAQSSILKLATGAG
jgi:hypothetical protein